MHLERVFEDFGAVRAPEARREFLLDLLDDPLISGGLLFGKVTASDVTLHALHGISSSLHVGSSSRHFLIASLTFSLALYARELMNSARFAPQLNWSSIAT
jgi:hypothetical protein